MAIPQVASESIAVWIPLIVGLAPGLVYWFVITGMRNRK
jgi:hypothetical protein